MYRNERAFSKALCTKLTEHGIFYQRIESGGTSAGIPDLYVRSLNVNRWLELKCIPTASINDESIIVPWRPGQKAWALKYLKASWEYVLTLCAVKDGFILIRMDTIILNKRGNIIEGFIACPDLNALMEDLIRRWL
jgi:hypothetical protein